MTPRWRRRLASSYAAMFTTQRPMTVLRADIVADSQFPRSYPHQRRYSGSRCLTHLRLFACDQPQFEQESRASS